MSTPKVYRAPRAPYSQRYLWEKDKQPAPVAKCSTKPGEATCDTMHDALCDTATSTATKGFVKIDVHNMKTGESRVLGIAYKKSPRDVGMMLNFCPFCGAKYKLEGAKK